MVWKNRFLIHLSIIFILSLGCSSSQGERSPVEPSIDGNPEYATELTAQEPGNTQTSWHSFIGFWLIEFNTTTIEFTVHFLRQADFHMNIVSVLQAPNPNCIKVVLNDFDQPNGVLDFDLTIIHPVPNSDLRVFDTRGIFMGSGDMIQSKFDPEIIYPAPNAMRVSNADGYSRWWNAQEFLTPGLFGYTPGKLGFSNFFPETTLNGYKYFADPLGPKDNVVPGVDTTNRGTFSTDKDLPELTRNYIMKFPIVGGNPIWFLQYAIDVNWHVPDGDSPTPKPIDDFPISANCPEAFHIKVDTSGTTAYYVNQLDLGGDIELSIEVFDWGAVLNNEGIDGEIEALLLESDTLFEDVISVPLEAESSSMETSGIYNVTIPDVQPNGLSGQEILITVQSKSPTSYISPIGFPSYPQNGHLSAYTLVEIPVSPKNPTPPAIDLVKPDGGEFWTIGSTQLIDWDWEGSVPAVNIDISLDGGSTWPLAVASNIINEGAFSIDEVGIWPSDECRIRVESSGAPEIHDISKDDFTIGFATKSINLLSPDGGEQWITGESEEITWEATGDIPEVNLLLSHDSGDTYNFVIVENVLNTGSFIWESIPSGAQGNNCRIKVEDVNEPGVFDVSDDDFTIIFQWIILQTPNGGEVWEAESEYEIQWISGSGIDDVKLDYSTDSGSTYPNEITSSTPNTGSFNWTAPNIHSEAVRVRIQDAGKPSLIDESDADFTITQPTTHLNLWSAAWDVERMVSVEVDSDNNTYIAGNFKTFVDPLDFDPGPGEAFRETNTGINNFLLKMDYNGDFGWVSTWGPDMNGHEFVIDMDLVEPDDIFVLSADETYIRWDFTVSNYDTDGNLLGTFPFKYEHENGYELRIYGFEVDSSGNAYFTGFFETKTHFNPDSGNDDDEIIPLGQGDAFCVKYDSSGNFLWVNTWGSAAGNNGDVDSGHDLLVDEDGSVYVTGVTWQHFPHKALTFVKIITDDGEDDLYAEWSSFFEIDTASRLRHMAQDGSGNIYITGPQNGQCDFDPGAGEVLRDGMIYILKLSQYLEYAWVRNWTSTQQITSKGLTVNSADEVYMTGYFRGTVDFDTGIPIENHLPVGWSDTFVTKLDTSGTYDWTVSSGGPGYDTGMDCAATDSYVLVIGSFEETVDFDPGPNEDLQTAVDEDDGFAVAYPVDFDW